MSYSHLYRVIYIICIQPSFVSASQLILFSPADCCDVCMILLLLKHMVKVFAYIPVYDEE